MEISTNTRLDGWFDQLSSIFEAHDHPVILVEDAALSWMGVALPWPVVSNNSHLGPGAY
jgi:hypothetical protein